jgi:hypothetical protein
MTETGPERMEAFQARGVAQGKAFDEQCRLVLQGLGFWVNQRPFKVTDVGIEIDAEIRSRAGQPFWCEFKGSWHGTRPGSRRTDTVKKALADALLLHVAPSEYPPVLLITSHLPAEGRSGAQMIKTAIESGALRDVICLNVPADMERLRKLASEGPERPMEGQQELFEG